MEQFVVSARKYRPNSFESLIGQDNIARTLKNSILRDQLAHAYLFCGPRGVGKTTTARIFAKSINCLNPTADMEPCGVCESCQSFAEGRSYCIHELDAASNNSVDDIRNLTEMVRIPPQIGKYGVFIIDEVHMLSASAFNAFLKTLEEPPAHAIFILATTEKHKILPTILSRCQTYDFNRISIPDIVSNLQQIAQQEGVSIEEDALHILAQKADGAMRDALTLFDQTVAFCGKDISYAQVVQNLNVLDYEYYFKLTQAALQGDHTTALLLFDEVLQKGFNALHFLSGLSSHLRDLLVCKHEASKSLLSLPPTVVSRYEAQAAECSIKWLYQALNITTTCEAGFKQAGNQRLLIEFALIKWAMLTAEPTALAQPAQPAAPARTATTAPATHVAPTPQAVPAAQTSAAPTANTPAPTANTPAPQETPQTPAQPAATVQPAEQPAPAPATKPATRTTPGISLKAMLAQAEAATRTEQQETVAEKNSFTQEDFAKAWNAYIQDQQEKNRHSLAAALQKTQLIFDLVSDTPSVTFFVDNASQQEWIRKKNLPEMEDFIRRRLKNTLVQILVEVTPDEAKAAAKPYMPSEKAKQMLSDHEELRQLKTDLDLDIK